MNVLLPCPFCGSPALNDKTLGGKEWVSCSARFCKANELEMNHGQWNMRQCGPGMPSSTPQAVIDAYRCGEFSTVSPCPTPCACDDMAHHDYQLIRRILATHDEGSK